MLNEIFKDISPILTKASPLIATALGSPVAGLAVSILSNIFEADPKNPNEIVNKILENVPEATNKLKCSEADHCDIFKSILGARQPSHLEFHVKVSFDDKVNLS